MYRSYSTNTEISLLWHHYLVTLIFKSRDRAIVLLLKTIQFLAELLEEIW